jgi:hypothetical protein
MRRSWNGGDSRGEVATCRGKDICPEAGRVPVPYPIGPGSDEDREAFRCGFTITLEFNTDSTYSEPFGWELSELESKYSRPCST